MTADHDYESAKVEAFGKKLLADPYGASRLASDLLIKVHDSDNPLTLAFAEMTTWEKAGVVDELRDALDKRLGEVFQHYVKMAREETETGV